jgi:hypothetical protein
VGEVIHITPAEVQGISIALGLLAEEVFEGFRSELDSFIAASRRGAT